MRSAWVVASFLAACAVPPLPHTATPDFSAQAETPEQATLRLWAIEHGPAKPLCAEHVHNADIRVLTEEDLNKECERDNVAACMVNFDPKLGGTILLKDTQEGKSYEIRVHELLHILVVCAGIKEGNKHSDLVWRHVPMANLTPDSPWFLPRPTPVVVLPL